MKYLFHKPSLFLPSRVFSLFLVAFYLLVRFLSSRSRVRRSVQSPSAGLVDERFFFRSPPLPDVYGVWRSLSYRLDYGSLSGMRLQRNWISFPLSLLVRSPTFSFDPLVFPSWLPRLSTRALTGTLMVVLSLWSVKCSHFRVPPLSPPLSLTIYQAQGAEGKGRVRAFFFSL